MGKYKSVPWSDVLGKVDTGEGNKPHRTIKDMLPLELTLAETFAWWMITGEAQPTNETRFVHGSVTETKKLAYTAAHIQLLLDEANVAGIGQQLSDVFKRLFANFPKGA